MRLCVCVDDVGLHAGILDAALPLVGAARVHALACMVGAPAWPAATPALRRLESNRVDIGLHLDLTDHPLAPGRPATLARLVLAAGLRRIDRTTLRTTIRRQLDAFEAALGRAPAFVDGHRHVHQLPGVRDELIAELASRYARGSRPWLRATRPGRAAARFQRKARVIEFLGAAALARLAADCHIAQNHRLLGVYDFRGGQEAYLGLVLQWLAAARSGDLLMCHAGRGPTDALQAARNAEFAVWMSAAVGDALRDRSIVLQPLSRTLVQGLAAA